MIRAKTGGDAGFSTSRCAKRKSALTPAGSSKTPRQVVPKTGGDRWHKDPRSGSMARFRGREMKLFSFCRVCVRLQPCERVSPQGCVRPSEPRPSISSRFRYLQQKSEARRLRSEDQVHRMSKNGSERRERFSHEMFCFRFMTEWFRTPRDCLLDEVAVKNVEMMTLDRVGCNGEGQTTMLRAERSGFCALCVLHELGDHLLELLDAILHVLACNTQSHTYQLKSVPDTPRAPNRQLLQIIHAPSPC